MMSSVRAPAATRGLAVDARDALEGGKVRLRLALGVKLRPSRRVVSLVPPRVDDRVRIAGSVVEIDYLEDIVGRGWSPREVALALRTLSEPVVFRGGAAGWRANETWTSLEDMIRCFGEDWECDVRLINDLGALSDGESTFVYCEESHAAVRDGTFTPPSVTRRMKFAAAVARVLRIHGDGAYIQSAISEERSRDCVGGVHVAFNLSESGWRESQERRLWLALASSVTPLHFDASWSTLTQVGVGSKRMLLFEPFALKSIGLYPNWHPLRRRGREFPDVAALEVTIHPGDVLVFPPRWSHYTESLGDCVSASITQRSMSQRDEIVVPEMQRAVERWARNRDRPKALERLVSMNIISDDFGCVSRRCASTGEVAPLDDSMWLLEVNDEWRRAAHSCAQTVEECLGANNIHGVYLRGSVAQGRARAGVSDVDLIVLTKKVFRDEEKDAARATLDRHWLPRFEHLVTKADVRFHAFESEKIDVNELSNSDSVVTFVLATQSLTLSGLDLPTLLPTTARIPKMQVLDNIHSDVARALDHGSEKALRWALKRLVRATYEKFALPNRAVPYTRDLYQCVKLVLEYTDIDGSDLMSAVIAAIHGSTAWSDVFFTARAKALAIRLDRFLMN